MCSQVSLDQGHPAKKPRELVHACRALASMATDRADALHLQLQISRFMQRNLHHCCAPHQLMQTRALPWPPSWHTSYVDQGDPFSRLHHQ